MRSHLSSHSGDDCVDLEGQVRLSRYQRGRCSCPLVTWKALPVLVLVLFLVLVLLLLGVVAI